MADASQGQACKVDSPKSTRFGGSRKRLGIGCISIALVAVLAVAALVAADCRRGIVSACNYGRIEIGMTLAEVEDILGPGWEELGEGWFPRPPQGDPALPGERFFRWEDRSTSKVVWVVMRGDQVCATDYWEPSF